MAQQYFVMGIGGTGMRCIESLIHLCAMGMFDDTEIHLLALDTDVNNGNFGRLKAVKDAYNKAKGINHNTQTVLTETFFSAKINYYQFSPDYQQNRTFNAVFDYNNTKYNNREAADLADLVFTKDVETFDLLHGYRAQTHLGSMMMYHSIVAAMSDPRPNDMKTFIAQLISATQNGTSPRVFILGSVFGGTGASSIPIIPKALSDAASAMGNGGANILVNCYFGSTLLTAYFSFPTPTANQILQEKVIASSDKFALNSQAAMMFYDDDTTVKSTYQKFYMLGTDNLNWNPMTNDTSTSTITGGQAQKNDSHYIELLAACAALDFLNEDQETLQNNKNNVATDYVCRIADEKFNFEDFVGSNRAMEFAQKFGNLLAFSLFCNGTDDFVESVRTGGHKEIQEFHNMSPDQVLALKEYFNYFFCRKKSSGKLAEGWLQQIHRSAGGGDHFLFGAGMFTASDMKSLMKTKWDKILYRADDIASDKKYSYKIWSSKFDCFKSKFIDTRDRDKEWAKITNLGEQFYKLTFDTLKALYNF